MNTNNNSFCITKDPIGTQYLPKGRKNAKVCTITECFKTFDSEGNLVRVFYQSKHDFLGQAVINNDVCETTIARGIENLKEKQKHSVSKANECVGA